MRLGIFGGSFDPPHVGHLLTAIDAFEFLRLDKLILVPAAVQPLKAGLAAATAAQRLAMVRLLVSEDDRFAVDAVEIERAGLSYTVDTLETFAQRFPHAEMFFLVGMDAVAAFGSWKNPRRIMELARLAILRRPGTAVGESTIDRDGTIDLATRLIDVSSTEVRERVRARKSIRGFVPESVAAFIETERLYR
ncbi:MAG: nicotinate-nucleotide adenylyltransferase [Gemmatimonadaceae bacterium]